MPRKRFTPEQVIAKLREAEVLLAYGQPAVQVYKQIGVSEQTYYPLGQQVGVHGSSGA
ncbi:MAG: hypothetical protein HS116_19235 [Planctomycetes bacterium]|nr:hypothetical protein [Planctomycetota bacterium]